MERIHLVNSTDPYVHFFSEKPPHAEAGALILYFQDQFHILLPRSLIHALAESENPGHQDAMARLLHELIEIKCLEMAMRPSESHWQATDIEFAYRRHELDYVRRRLADLQDPYRAARVELQFFGTLAKNTSWLAKESQTLAI